MPKTVDGEYRSLEWRANHFLHLQRLAHGELGARDWQQGAWDIPIALVETGLAVLVEEKGLPYFACRSCAASSLKEEFAKLGRGSRLKDDGEEISASGKFQASIDVDRVSQSTDTFKGEKATQVVAKIHCHSEQATHGQTGLLDIDQSKGDADDRRTSFSEGFL